MEVWYLTQNSSRKELKKLYSAKRFNEIAKKRKIELKFVQPEQFELLVTRDDRKSVLLDDKLVALPNVLMPRMGAGSTYFALAVIRQLERLGVYSFPSSDGVEKVKDKLYTQQILAQSGIPVPKTILMKKPTEPDPDVESEEYPLNIDLVEKQLGFPVIVKTLSGSKGIGVFLCETRKQFIDLTELIMASKPQVNIIVQEFVSTSRGRDLRVVVVGNQVVACYERIGKEGDYKANFSQGGEVREYKTNLQIEQLALETAKILELDLAGVDLLFDGESFKICEVNSAPGFEGLEKSCPISFPDKVFDFLEIRLGFSPID